MDPSLLKERDAFKRKLLSQPAVEARRPKPTPDERPQKKPKPSKPRDESTFNYKTMAGSSQYKFSILAKIVKFMKHRHQVGDFHPLNINEILDETNQLDVNIRIQHWLSTEALPNNPKIEMKDGEKFLFKPPYYLRDKKDLINLLKKNAKHGMEGLMLDDVAESLPAHEKILKQLGERVIIVTRPLDKRKVLFYNDKNYHFNVDEEFKKLWRSVAVEGIDERKIEEHLQRHGITSMQDIGQKKGPIRKKKGGNKRKRGPIKTHNEHMGDILEDYSNK